MKSITRHSIGCEDQSQLCDEIVKNELYVNTKTDRAILALKPKPALKAIFRIATAKGGSGVILDNEKAVALSEGKN